MYHWNQEEIQNSLKIFIIVQNKNLKQKRNFVSKIILFIYYICLADRDWMAKNTQEKE